MDLTEQDAVELAARKTACLFAGCARLGAVLGNLDDAGEQALADYGHYMGLAFQLVDDVLDFTASPEKLGKPVLSDLKEGKVTLPLIYALERASAEERRLVETILQERSYERVPFRQIRTLTAHAIRPTTDHKPPLIEVSAGRLAAAGHDAQHWLMYGRDYSNQRFSPLADKVAVLRKRKR